MGRVVELLEQDGWSSAEDLARAVIKLCAGLIAARGAFAVAHTYGDGAAGLNIGPFGTEADAARLGALLGGGEGATYHVVALASPAAMLANQHGGGAGAKAPWCGAERCGHAPFAHSSAGTTRGACLICECKEYRK
ncbi:hypothetical protein [Pseudactinotalea sp.]|uniref:hypothetical protein n=1 Tax=Pseudactinotalea sp. TaxID=1926260 RepID=UPI003B39FCAA